MGVWGGRPVDPLDLVPDRYRPPPPPPRVPTAEEEAAEAAWAWRLLEHGLRRA